MDMSPAYLKERSSIFLQAQIVFDKFHVMLLAGQALDTVRRQLQHDGAALKGSLWSLRGNVWNLSAERQKQRRDLCAQYTKLGRAMTLRETLQAIYASPDQLTAQSQLQWWCGWAVRSRLEPFRTLAKTVRQHWEGILAYFDTGLTSAAIEAVNGIIQLAREWLVGLRILSISGPLPTCALLASNLTFQLSTNSNYPHKTAEKPKIPLQRLL